MSINRHRKAAILFLLCDLAAVGVAFNLVFFLRGVSSHPFLVPLIAPGIIFALSVHLIDGYGATSDMMSLDYASLHIIASVSAAFGTWFLTFGFIPNGFELQSSRGAILLSFALIGPFTLGLRRFYYARTLVSRNERSLVFVGEAGEFEIFKAECARMGTVRPLIHVDPSDNFGAFDSILESVATGALTVEAIVVKESGRSLPGTTPMKLVELYFNGVPTYTLEIFHQVYWRKIPLYRINTIWLLQEGFQIAREPVFERIKRISDIVLSLVGLVLFSWVIGLAAIAIKLEDGGPVFFAQSRVGRHRVPFKLFKLRTMRVADATGDLYTRPGDSRITRMGRLIRSARLDELPQLWNVLAGQMSLIGPRAEWDRLVKDYEAQIPSYHFRHLVKPGITGWAQVNYRYGANIQDTLRKLEYDLYYIRNYSFMLDASIVLKTFHVMILQKGH